MRPRTLNDVFNAPDVSLAMIQRENSEVYVRALLALSLTEMIKFFNVGKSMTDTQVAITCDLIMEAYPYFKLEDLKLCFRKAMLGQYGKLFDRLDGAIILEWISKYEKERCLEAQHREISQNKIYKKESFLGSTGAIIYNDYLKMLEHKASTGDETAIQALQASKTTHQLLEKITRKTYYKY